MLFTVVASADDASKSIAWPFTGRHRLRLTSWQSYGSTVYPYVLITSRTVVNPMQPELLFALPNNFDNTLDGSGGFARTGYFETELSGVYDFQIRGPSGDLLGGVAVRVILTFEIEKI